MNATLSLAIAFHLFGQTAASASVEPTIGPAKGSLVIVGGGGRDGVIVRKFVELAGGPKAKIIVIPTASEGEDFEKKPFVLRSFKGLGVKDLTILHTRDRKIADSDDFIKPLREATGVWFGGGRQWRLVDAYLNTKTHTAIAAVLERGGAVGGTSAGATIQGSYLVRGAREGNQKMMAPGYEAGMGFLKHSAIDQHVIARKRLDDMFPVIARHPKLLGIGVDENTALVVRGNVGDVIGASKVAFYDATFKAEADGKPFFLLSAGDRIDLLKRRRIDRESSNSTQLSKAPK